MMLVFGDGLLGNILRDRCVVLSHKECDITNRYAIRAALRKYKPKVVINCAGIVPKRNDKLDVMYQVNAVGPLNIEEECFGCCKFVQISTNCVFNGLYGNYTEKDVPDPRDNYGWSKLLGERGDLVIRTSFIGLPDNGKRGLLYWLQHAEHIVGYDGVAWNGVTHLTLRKLLYQYIDEGREGLFHIYSEPTTKYDILVAANEIFGFNKTIIPESSTRLTVHLENKTLNSIYNEPEKPIKEQLQEMQRALFGTA